MSTDAICTCSHGLGVLRHADDCPVAIERRQPVRLAAPSAPSEPVPDGPRVWAMPELPEDVSAVRDAEGRIWRPIPSGALRSRDTDSEYYRTRFIWELLVLGPLTEVVEESTP